MINVKLIVLLFSFCIVAITCNYCAICPNHTLCKYTMTGPSSSCKGYDADPITKDDVNDIINKINERRNLVASGLIGLPQAANMNKIYWSEKLAAIAQRWVDQCDSTTKPDKEDECRDFDDTKVGQAIVSVALPAPGMQLKSLIDVWFMQSRDYRGSVSYYNQSRDWKTNYFTQLIWGDTDRIGCGRARFYVRQKDSMIERMVCNFAPKGNVHGKPVYAVGYPATQCQQNKTPDKKFKSLCRWFIEENEWKLASEKPPVTSLLRILNLSNTTKPNADRRNLQQFKFDVNETSEQRNQKTRHVPFNNSYAILKNIPPLPIQAQWNSQTNYSRAQRLQNYHQERGHSRVYHGHDIHNHNLDSDYRDTTNQFYQTQNYAAIGNYPTNINFRKFNDYTTEPTNSQSSTNLRKYNRNDQCTRKVESRNNNFQKKQTCDECTRQQNKNCMHTVPPCQSNSPCTEKQASLCPCNTPSTTCATLPPRCPCNANCKCFNAGCNTDAPPFRRSDNDEKNVESKKSGEFHYYDLLPSMEIRSGDDPVEKTQSTSAFSWIHHIATIEDNPKRLPLKIRHDQKQVKEIFTQNRIIKQDDDYMYDSSYSRERKRRNSADEIPFKPFWQMDEFNRGKSTLLKSMRYTTLPIRKYQKTRRIHVTTTVRTPTESITVKKEVSSPSKNHKNAITEKYLSFDELMHLRKFSSTQASPSDANTEAKRDASFDARRDSNADARRADSVTPEYTTNTPFMRKKHCTRKLTCTWTAPTIVDEKGSVIVPGNGGDRGSRTPPGYVEGCTRTSTCTRDFMDRNKIKITSDETGSGEATPEDEDYCEKRALDVHKRDSEVEDVTVQSINEESFTKGPYTAHITYTYIEEEHTYISSTVSTLLATTTNDCICNGGHYRIKRHGKTSQNLNSGCLSQSHDTLSYGDLYYLVLQKFMQVWQNNKKATISNSCLCNSASLARGCISLLLFIILYHTIIKQFFV